MTAASAAPNIIDALSAALGEEVDFQYSLGDTGRYFTGAAIVQSFNQNAAIGILNVWEAVLQITGAVTQSDTSVA
jgi:hypothetical protein